MSEGTESALRILRTVMPSQTLLAGMPYVRSEKTDIRALFNRLNVQSAEIAKSQREFMQSVEKGNVA